jgi:hypothetical protein
MLNRLVDTGAPVALQDTTLSLDVLGRFICSTWDEATKGLSINKCYITEAVGAIV